MEIVALTMVGNEQEIIESFVRYNSHFVDEIVFVSSCCVDNTLVIIRKLMSEGYSIRLFEETEIAFDQRYLDNKYLKMIAKENTADWIIPLDCDEFIAGDKNPREVFSNLSIEQAYIIKWKNYIMTKEDDMNQNFIPCRCTHIKKTVGENYIGKVIVPAKKVIENQLCLSTGHHDIIGRNIGTQIIEEIWLAHYPAISREQYLLRIYESSIKYITWRKRAFDEGYHVYRQIKEIESGKDVYEAANNYVQIEESDEKIENAPLDLQYCDEDGIKIRYEELSHINVLKGVQKIGQLMAIKAYCLELELEEAGNKDKVLIYGSGLGAERLLNGIPDDMVSIRAYIDENPDKKFRMFKKKLIIPPDYIRFFNYDYIVISSQAYFNEMVKRLQGLGIEENKICSPARLFDVWEKVKSNG